MSEKELSEAEKTGLAGLFAEDRSGIGMEETRLAVSRAGDRLHVLEKKGIPRALEGLWMEIRLLYDMLSDAARGRYALPMRSLGAAAFALLYFVNPMDMMPDIIPLVGYIDDAFIIRLCVEFISRDLADYRFWLAERETD